MLLQDRVGSLPVGPEGTPGSGPGRPREGVGPSGVVLPPPRTPLLYIYNRRILGVQGSPRGVKSGQLVPRQGMPWSGPGTTPWGPRGGPVTSRFSLRNVPPISALLSLDHRVFSRVCPVCTGSPGSPYRWITFSGRWGPGRRNGQRRPCDSHGHTERTTSTKSGEITCLSLLSLDNLRTSADEGLHGLALATGRATHGFSRSIGPFHP